MFILLVIFKYYFIEISKQEHTKVDTQCSRLGARSSLGNVTD